MFLKHIIQKWLNRGMRKRRKILKSLDYQLIHAAYEKYSLAILPEHRATLTFPVFETPKVSIIIPVYNQYFYTMRCLQSIVDYTKDISYEIVIADDNSTDETQYILDTVANISVIKNITERGFLNNCNHAAKFSKGQYLYLLNNDTQIFPQTISALVKVFDDVSVAIAGSKCVYPNSKLQSAGTVLSGYHCLIGEHENPLDEKFNSFALVDGCIGASLMVRRSFWEKVGGFDKRFAPGYYEESDLCKQAWNMGFKVAYQPESEIIHFGGVSFNKDTEALMRLNKKKFCKKWRN